MAQTNLVPRLISVRTQSSTVPAPPRSSPVPPPEVRSIHMRALPILVEGSEALKWSLFSAGSSLVFLCSCLHLATLQTPATPKIALLGVASLTSCVWTALQAKNSYQAAKEASRSVQIS
jgi:hypothetical protein